MSLPLPEPWSEGAIFLTEEIAIKPHPEADGSGGYLFMHRDEQSEPDLHVAPGWCVGSFSFPDWTLVQREPLTVSPSILCVSHGVHGFITDGKWIGA